MEPAVLITIVFFMFLAASLGIGVFAAIQSDEDMRRDRGLL